MSSTFPMWGPSTTRVEVVHTVDALHSAGVQRRSLGVVDLKLRAGLEQDPLIRWRWEG